MSRTEAIAIALLRVLVYPPLTIMALNVVFGLTIPINWQTWIYMMFLLGILAPEQKRNKA